MKDYDGPDFYVIDEKASWSDEDIEFAAQGLAKIKFVKVRTETTPKGDTITIIEPSKESL